MGNANHGLAVTRGMPITACYFIMTENCNLRCVYCFEKNTRAVSKVIDLESAHKLINFLFSEAMRSENPNMDVDITFFGGEPMLAINECIDILKYACKKRDETGRNVKFLVITNATIYNEKVEEFLQTWYDLCGTVMIQLSIDGIPEIQNANRPCANKNLRSSDLIEENVAKYQKWIREHNLSWDKVFVHCVVSKSSLPMLWDNYEYFTKRLRVRFEFAWVYEDPWDDDDTRILDEQLDRIIADMGTWATDIWLFPFKHSDKCAGCGSGKQLVSMDTEGNLYPCHRFFFYSMDSRSEMKLGNINDDIPINEDIRNQFIDLDVDEVCGEPCQFCMAVNYETTGRIDKMPNRYAIDFMSVINHYYDIYVQIIERRMTAINIKNLNDRCDSLEKCVIRLANILKDKFNMSEEELPITTSRDRKCNGSCNKCE